MHLRSFVFALFLISKQGLGILMQGALIPLEREDVLSPLFLDLLGDLGLAAHRIDGHNRARQIQEPEQLRHRVNLIRFFMGFDLTQQ